MITKLICFIRPLENKLYHSVTMLFWPHRKHIFLTFGTNVASKPECQVIPWLNTFIIQTTVAFRAWIHLKVWAPSSSQNRLNTESWLCFRQATPGNKTPCGKWPPYTPSLLLLLHFLSARHHFLTQNNHNLYICSNLSHISGVNKNVQYGSDKKKTTCNNRVRQEYLVFKMLHFTWKIGYCLDFISEFLTNILLSL